MDEHQAEVGVSPQDAPQPRKTPAMNANTQIELGGAEIVDAHLDSILRASGSSLRHYTMQKTLDDMRAAMKTAMASTVTLTSAANDVLAERCRQIESEGMNPSGDIGRADQLAAAAACYALNASVPMKNIRPPYWPWHPTWWKPTTSRRDKIKAAALLLASIEAEDNAANTGA